MRANSGKYGLFVYRDVPEAGINAKDISEYLGPSGYEVYAARVGVGPPLRGGSFEGLRQLIFRHLPPELRKGVTLSQVEVRVELPTDLVVFERTKAGEVLYGAAEDPQAGLLARQGRKYFPLMRMWRRLNVGRLGLECWAPVVRVYLLDLMRVSEEKVPGWLRRWVGRPIEICKRCKQYFPVYKSRRFCSRECQSRASSRAYRRNLAKGKRRGADG